jgi:putative ABC transport system ATP-binding protein
MLPNAANAHDGVMTAISALDPVAPNAMAAGIATSSLIEARQLTRVWGKGSAAQVGIDRVDLDIGRGEVVAIVGPSGSGKSTLGALLSGIDVPTSGSLVINGTRVDRLKHDRLAAWRGANVGIVFQDFHLLPTLTAGENVELAVELSGSGASRRLRRRAAHTALTEVGLGAAVRKLPAQMSGGEQQRVGIARALVTRPPLIVADEPTGALDQANGHAVFEILTGLARTGSTVVFITHDLALAASADRVVSMVDGRIASITDRTGV